MDEATNIEELLEHEDFVRSLAYRLVFDGHEVDEVVQETWLAALKRPPRRGPGLKAWLAKVLLNVVRQQRRGDDRRQRREQRETDTRSVSTPDELLQREELRSQLVQALSQLDPRYRDVLLLHYFEGLAPRQIAASLDLPLETVKTRLGRAITRLRVKLDDQYRGDRRAWQIALTPLAAVVPEISGVAGVSAATIASLGKGTVMSLKTKLALAGILLTVLLLLAYTSDESSLPDRAVSPGESCIASSAQGDPPSKSGRTDRITPDAALPASSRQSSSTVTATKIGELTQRDRVLLRLHLQGIPAAAATNAQVTVAVVDD